MEVASSARSWFEVVLAEYVQPELVVEAFSWRDKSATERDLGGSLWFGEWYAYLCVAPYQASAQFMARVPSIPGVPRKNRNAQCGLIANGVQGAAQCMVEGSRGRESYEGPST